MTSRLFALTIAALDPTRLARFWAGLLDWEVAEGSPDEIALLPKDDTGFRIRFLPTQEQKAARTRSIST